MKRCTTEGSACGSARQVPLNVWLPWLPQLQTSLQRPEAALVKDLLAQLATTYPQAVYYGLRTILLSLREVPLHFSYCGMCSSSSIATSCPSFLVSS